MIAELGLSQLWVDLLLVEMSSSCDVGARAGGGGEAGRVVHHGVRHVVVPGRVPALLLLLPGHRGDLGPPREARAAAGQVGHTVATTSAKLGLPANYKFCLVSDPTTQINGTGGAES